MRYFFLCVLFLNFSLLFSQNTSDTSAVSRAKLLYSKGKNTEAWELLSRSLLNHTKSYNLEAVELALDWFFLEKRAKEALALIENVLPTTYRIEKGRILLKRIDYYLNTGDNLSACADLDEAEYLGISSNELASRRKISCPTYDIETIASNQVFHYDMEPYKHDQKKYSLDISLHAKMENELTDYEWFKSNSQETGMISLEEEEKTNGMMETRYLDLENPNSEGGEAPAGANGGIHLAFVVPTNKFYSLLTTGKMSLSIRNEEDVFVMTRSQKLLVKIGEKYKLLNCIYAKSNNNEIWVLDNKKFPIIVRTNINAYTATLKEIN